MQEVTNCIGRIDLIVKLLCQPGCEEVSESPLLLRAWELLEPGAIPDPEKRPAYIDRFEIARRISERFPQIDLKQP